MVVAATSEDGLLPFADEALDLVVSRHPVLPRFVEVARDLAPGGTLLTQHVGPRSAFDLLDLFLRPGPAEDRRDRYLEAAVARNARPEIAELRTEHVSMELHDVGAIVWFLRKVLWLAPPPASRPAVTRCGDCSTASKPRALSSHAPLAR